MSAVPRCTWIFSGLAAVLTLAGCGGAGVGPHACQQAEPPASCATFLEHARIRLNVFATADTRDWDAQLKRLVDSGHIRIISRSETTRRAVVSADYAGLEAIAATGLGTSPDRTNFPAQGTLNKNTP